MRMWDVVGSTVVGKPGENHWKKLLSLTMWKMEKQGKLLASFNKL